MASHFRARFPGRCAYCQGFFEAGDLIKRLDTPVKAAIASIYKSGTDHYKLMKYAHAGCEEPRYRELRDEAKQMAEEQDTVRRER